jgi:Spy/CpxP family protein refolding chaperone
MNFNTKSILLLLVIFLAGTNVAVVVTYQRHLRAEHKANSTKIELPDTQIGKFFQEELNLTSEQQEKFREFRRKYNRSANKVMHEMSDIRNEMAQNLKPINPNRDKLERLAEDLGQKHKTLKGLTFDYYQDLQSILDKEQQEKMSLIFQSMLTSEGDAKTPGQGRQGGGQGRGRGQGWQNSSDSVIIINE